MPLHDDATTNDEPTGSDEVPDTSVADTWQQRFALIEKAGGSALPDFKQLTLREQQALLFNFLGFVFGPFYFLSKGMWRQAVTLTAIGLAVSFAFEHVLLGAGASESLASVASGFAVPAICAVRANVAYYKKVCLGEDGWI